MLTENPRNSARDSVPSIKVTRTSTERHYHGGGTAEENFNFATFLREISLIFVKKIFMNHCQMIDFIMYSCFFIYFSFD